MALRELDWHRLWWIIWRVSNHGRSVQDLMFFIYFSSLSWVCLFQGCWLISDPARCWIWSSDQSGPHPWWDTRPCRHWGRVLSCALEPLVTVQCWAFISSACLACIEILEIPASWNCSDFSDYTCFFHKWKQKPSVSLGAAAGVHSYVTILIGLFFFFLWKLNEKCKMFLI